MNLNKLSENIIAIILSYVTCFTSVIWMKMLCYENLIILFYHLFHTSPTLNNPYWEGRAHGKQEMARMGVGKVKGGLSSFLFC